MRDPTPYYGDGGGHIGLGDEGFEGGSINLAVGRGVVGMAQGGILTIGGFIQGLPRGKGGIVVEVGVSTTTTTTMAQRKNRRDTMMMHKHHYHHYSHICSPQSIGALG